MTIMTLQVDRSFNVMEHFFDIPLGSQGLIVRLCGTCVLGEGGHGLAPSQQAVRFQGGLSCSIPGVLRNSILYNLQMVMDCSTWLSATVMHLVIRPGWRGSGAVPVPCRVLLSLNKAMSPLFPAPRIFLQLPELCTPSSGTLNLQNTVYLHQTMKKPILFPKLFIMLPDIKSHTISSLPF